MDQLSSILSQLSLAENKEEVLQGIRPALSALSRADISTRINGVDLVVLFDCLNTKKTGQLEVSCEVLQYLLQFMDPAIILERYGEMMIHGLAHPDPRVPLLILRQLHRCARDEEIAGLVVRHPLFLHVVRLIQAELSVSQEVSRFLLQLADSKSGLEVLVGNRTASVLQELAAADQTVNIRILELVVKISQISQEHLEMLEASGLLQPLLHLVEVNDVLVKLNAVELVTEVAFTHQGLRFLEKHGVLNKIEQLLQAVKTNPLADILLPGLVKFFGNIAHLRPKQMIVQHPHFVDCLFDLTESGDLTIRAIAFETIGYIGESLEGKTSLADIGNKMTNSIEKLETLIRDSPTEIRIRAMNAFASLIKLDKENQQEEFLSITESWYRRSLGDRPMKVLFEIYKQPFPEQRLAVYQVLANIAKQGWGRREILRFPGFPELLLDRAAERDKDGMDAKFFLIKCLVESGDSAGVVGADLDRMLREYVRLGPYHVQVQSQVASQGAN